MNKSCVNCHFFAKKTSLKNDDSVSISLNESDRTALKNTKEKPNCDKFSITLCHKGVWDEGIIPHENYYSSTVLEKRDACFFFPFRHNMLFKAADELQRREDEYTKFYRTNRNAVWGLWIAGIALVVNVLVKLFCNA